MNFDLSALANIAKLFGNMPNGAEKQSGHGQNPSQNAQNRRDDRRNGKTHANSPFVAQNGLYEQVDASSFDSSVKDNAQNTYASANDPKSPLDGIMSLMSKKNELEKMMPALKNVFSKQQTAKTASVDSKEKSKPKDVFSPIEFAGYTVQCAMNRLYFSTKNL